MIEIITNCYFDGKDFSFDNFPVTHLFKYWKMTLLVLTGILSIQLLKYLQKDKGPSRNCRSDWMTGKFFVVRFPAGSLKRGGISCLSSHFMLFELLGRKCTMDSRVGVYHNLPFHHWMTKEKLRGRSTMCCRLMGATHNFGISIILPRKMHACSQHCSW